MTDEEAARRWQIRECELRIQHLLFEKERLCRRHHQSMSEINSHLKNCRRSLETYIESRDA